MHRKSSSCRQRRTRPMRVETHELRPVVASTSRSEEQPLEEPAPAIDDIAPPQPDHRIVQPQAPRPPPPPDEPADAFASTAFIALTLVVMFALMVTLQIYLVESPTIQDFLGFNMSFNPDTLFVSNASGPPPPPAAATRKSPISASRRTPEHGRATPDDTEGVHERGESGAGRRAEQFGDLPTGRPVRPVEPTEAEEPANGAVPTYYTLSSDAMYHRFRSVCVYKARRKSRLRGGRSFGIDIFPYHLCTDAVYCCAAINASDATIRPGDATVDIFRQGWRNFSQLKDKNNFLRVWIAVGGGAGGDEEADRGAFSKIVRDESMESLFAANAVDWLEAQSFDGLLLYWKFPEVHEMSGLVDLLRITRASFRRLDHSLGIVVPLDHRLRERFDMRDLVDLMDDYSILVDPNEAVPPTYGRTALKWTQDNVERYAEAFRETQYTIRGHRRSGRFQLCYPLDIAAASYTLYTTDAEDNTTDEGVDASGPGQEGRSTRSPGRLAYDELCLRRRWDAMQDRPYCRVSLYGNQWITHPTPHTLGAFVRALMKATGGTRCLGIWDPWWDDFAGHCGEGVYPLTQTVFNVERGIGRKKQRHP